MPLDQSLPALRLPEGGTLALDLASITGVAYGREGIDRKPWFCEWHLPRIGGEGARYASFENELATEIDRLKPSALLLESTLPLPAMNNYHAAAQQFGLRAIAYSEAWRASCLLSEVDVHTVRQEVLGAGRLMKREEAKKLVVAWCHKRGMKVPSHNAGDAVVLWYWRMMRMTGAQPVAGPLWRDA